LAAIGDIKEGTFERWTDDESYISPNVIPITETGYYSYLPGRDDTEILSEGYTVANYRTDRVIGESVYSIIGRLNELDMTNTANIQTVEVLYAEGCQIIQTIYSNNYIAEMQAKLDKAYQEKGGLKPIVTLE